ncbi:DUF423 domain-containing protein [Chelatococcus reniformis]|uniref:DUF423 domain-containing protein n=1 Tax=Chelatococcus reniformis TaxID=1494448 RepID=A0A916UNE2_9HYPH|nr:DUF423 domain-containing protein [Chelatococcus reniformis]GGC80170.1 hypothetical protein GCM10010994_42680 [Chelatococcus reniformis]
MLDRLFVVLGALFGLAGVAAAAAAAHVTGEGNLGTAANFLLFHAPVLIAATAVMGQGLVRRGIARLAIMLIALGAILFCGDLALRALAHAPLFPMAAPTGGVVLMAGWLLLAVAALVPAGRSAG